MGTPAGVSCLDKGSGIWERHTAAAITETLRSSRVGRLAEDGHFIWFSNWHDSTEGAIGQLDRRTETFRFFGRHELPLKPTENPITYLRCITVDEDYVWFATEGRGLLRYNKASKDWTVFDEKNGLASNRISERALMADDNYVWVGTDRGLCRYDERKETWMTFTQSASVQAFRSIKVYAIAAEQRYVWVGMSRSLQRYDKQTDRWVDHPKPSITCVAVDENYVWVGTHCGLSRYDKRHSTWKHFQKEEEERRFPWEMPRPQEKKKKENELVDNNVVGLSLDERYVWIATEAGVGRYDKVADRFESYTKENQIPSNDVRFIGENRSHVWIGTKNGISKHNILSDDKNAWETYNTAIEVQPMLMKEEYARSLDNDDVRCLAVEEDRVWIGTKTGVSLYNLRKGTWRTFRQKDGLASDEVSCIAVDGENVWFGSGRGVSMYDTRNGSWQVFTERDGLASDLITSIAVSERYICFGTFDKGITILHKAENEFTTFTKKHGLPHNGILSIAIDGDLIWIGTHGGLTRYDTITQTWTIYTEGFDWDGV